MLDVFVHKNCRQESLPLVNSFVSINLLFSTIASGALAQWIGLLTGDLKVPGSNPKSDSLFFFFNCLAYHSESISSSSCEHKLPRCPSGAVGRDQQVPV